MSIEIGERLAELREEQGLTQEDLAEQIPVGRSTIGSYETNNSQPSYAVLIELADFFGVSTDYLLGRTKIRNARFFPGAVSGQGAGRRSGGAASAERRGTQGHRQACARSARQPRAGTNKKKKDG